MNDVTVVLMAAGDCVGELPIDNLIVGISDAEPGRYEVPVHQAACVYTQLIDALQREGFEVASDEIDFRLAVSRALVSGPDTGTISIPLDVRQLEGGGAATDLDVMSGSPAISEFDDLFGGAEDLLDPVGGSR